MSFLVVRRRTSDEEAIARGAIILQPDALDRLIAERTAQAIADLRAGIEAEAQAAGAAAAQREAAEQRAAAEAQAAQAMQALAEAARQLAAPLGRKEDALADLVVDFGFRLARHLLLEQVAFDPGSVRTLIESILQQALRERTHEQSILLRLNPADHAALASEFDRPHLTLIADETVAQGGARVDLVAVNGDPLHKVEWDAEIETRLATLREALLIPAARSLTGTDTVTGTEAIANTRAADAAVAPEAIAA